MDGKALRKMDSVMDDEAEHLMGKHHLKRNEVSSAYSDTSLDEEDRGKYNRHKKGHRQKAHRSRKSKRISSVVSFPQKWPQAYLSLHYVKKL